MLQPFRISLSRSSDAVGHLHCGADEVEDQFQEFHDLDVQEEYSSAFWSMTSKCCCSPCGACTNTGWFLVDTVPGPAVISVERHAISSPNLYAVDVEQRSVGDLMQSRHVYHAGSFDILLHFGIAPGVR